MANGNKCNIDGLKYSKEHYVQIALAYELGGIEEAQHELEDLYGEGSSYIPVILEALEDGTFNEYWDFTPTKETSSEETPVLFNGAQKSEAPINDDLDRYYFNRENGWAEQREAEMLFVNEVLSRVLYNKTTRVFREPSTVKINSALYEYKLELLESLWKATGKDHSQELDGSDATFNRVINQTILEFGNIARDQNTGAYNNYIILKQFNKLISKYTPFIKFNSAYENVSEHGRDMYIWNPSGKYRSSWTDSEETDINNVTSPVIQTLLKYVPRVDANGNDMIEPIGLKMYNSIMSTILTWIRQNRNNFDDVKDVCRDIRERGLGADYNAMIEAYKRHVAISKEQKEVLRGIQTHILGNTGFLPYSLKMSLINQFFIQAKFSYFSLRVVDGKIKGQYLEDGFVSRQNNSLARSITTSVRMWRKEKDLYERLKASIGVTVESQGNDIIISLDKNVYGKAGKIIISKNPDSEGSVNITTDIKGNDLNPKAVINLIERVLERNIPDDYDTIVDSISSNNAVPTTLFNIFLNPIAIALAAAHEDIPYIFTNNNNGELNTFRYKNKFSDAAEFIGIDKGVNELSTLVNGEGNRLPIYQLAPAIFDLFDLIDYYIAANGDSSVALTNLITNGIIGSAKEKSVFPEHPYVVTPQLLKRIVVRSDTKIKNLVKSSDKLDVAEVANSAIFSEFYGNLIYNPSANENDRSTNRELEGCILMQPIVFSDKKTHFLAAINLSKAKPIDYINDNGEQIRVNALTALRELTTDRLDPITRSKYIEAFKNQSKNYIADRTKREVYNQYIRFKNVFSLDVNRRYKKEPWIPTNANFETFDALSAFYEIIDILSELNKEADRYRDSDENYTITPLELIREAFNKFRTSANGRFVALNEDFDIRVLKDGTLQGNETVFFNIKTALGDGIDFDRARTRDIKYFAMGLIEHDIFPDLIKNPELSAYFDNIKDKDKWIDSVGDFMRPFIAYKNKKRIEFTNAEIENDALLDPEVTIELNPILEAYFWAHNVYAVPLNELIFGIQSNYTPKVIKKIDFKTIDPLDASIEEMMASSLSMEFKRTTYGGADKRRFATGLTFGVPDMINWAGIDTTKRKISTIRGETHSAKTQDGNGWVDPILARMIQKSLLESPVGDVRKTIGGYVDPQTGAQIHFKWAEDTITTILRQRNDGDGSLEMMLKKGRGQFNISNKFKKITDFKRYYNPNATDDEIYKVAGEQITHTDYIYQYDIDNGIYYRIESISVNNGNLTVERVRVDEKTGKPILNAISELTSPKRITDLYTLDQALGGAWVYDFKNGNMVASEAVNDIIFHIVCENGMKNDFIGYFVGAEGCKAGHFNFNSYDRLSVGDSKQLAWYALSALGFGVLQNADHELDFSEVTEMSQMITLLSQNGRNVELVNQMYEDIGRVANEALRGIIKNLNNEKEIYRILGKALISSFETGNREELGLAQAFIRTTQKALEQNGNTSDIVLPYSAETIKGSFIAAVTSLINKKGIRRKYAGFGGVEVGAEDIMVHWDVEGKYLTYREARDYYRDMLKNYGISWNDLISKPILSNGILNPSMRRIQQNEVNFGDTIYIRKIGESVGKVIPIVKFGEYDLVTALLNPNEWEIYVWEAKSKQLGQSNQFYKTDKREFSEYNTDYVRAMFYLDDLLAAKAYTKKKGLTWTGWTGENVDRKIRVLQAAITNDDMSVVAGWSIENLINTDRFDHLVPQIQKMLRRKQSVYLNKISQIKNSRVAGTLPTQMIEKNDQASLTLEWQDIKDGKLYTSTGILQEESLVEPIVRKKVAQAAMGRKGAEKFLIKKGDKLSEIKERKQNFFYERLTEKADNFKRTKSQLGNLQYDAVLQLNNGENLIVFVGNPNNGNLYDGQDFVTSSDAIAYKGRVIVDNKLLNNTGEVSEIITKSYSLRNGDQIVPVMIVKDFDTLKRITKSSEVQQYRYNYTKKNWKDLVTFRKDHLNVSLQDENNAQYKVDISPETLEILPIDNPANISKIVSALNREELKYNRQRLMTKAQLLYRNFIASLSYIQTRIPSQAMESTMELEIVDILDIDTNYLWIPLMTHLFQGSDLDIDKGYCMGYDIDDNGNILAESDLIFNPLLPVDDVILLPKPNKSSIGFANQLIVGAGQEEKIVSAQEFMNIIKKGEANWTLMDYIREINKLTEENKAVIIDDIEMVPDNTGNLQTPDGSFRILQHTWDLVQQALNFVNVHNASEYDERRAEGALRNKVFVAARTIISEPSSQMDHMKPVSTDEAKDAAANSALGKKEKHLSIYQPLTIYEMQQQNMTGKTVIPLTATGIKSFFIISTGFNTIVHEIEKLLTQLDPNDDKSLSTIGLEIAKKLNQLTFDSVFTPNGEKVILRTFANINFDPLLEIAERFEYLGADGIKHNKLNEILMSTTVDSTRANEQCWGQFVQGTSFQLLNMIKHLDRYANGNTWLEKITVDGKGNQLVDYEYFVVNAADSLGVLLNAATDNAKELILEKLNANQKFADYYVALLMMGHKFSDIAKEMTSGAFRIVKKYASENIFDPSTHRFSIENAIDFVLDEKDLNNIDKNLLSSYIINSITKGGQYQHAIQAFDGFGRFLLDFNFALANGRSFQEELYQRLKISESDYQELKSGIYSIGQELTDSIKDRLETVLLSNSIALKNKFARVFIQMLNDYSIKTVEGLPLGRVLSKALLEHIKMAVENTPDIKRRSTSTPDEAFEINPDYSDDMILDETNDYTQVSGRQNFTVKKTPFTHRDLKNLYRYVRLYLIPKNEAWNSLPEQERSNGVTLLHNIKYKIIPAVNEIKMIGRSGSINQGLRVGDYEEYSFIESFNNFVNKAYMDRGKNVGQFEEFDLLKFLDDSEKDYHDRQVNQYDKVKVVVNVLQAIDGMANFKAMFKFTNLNRELMTHSAAIKFERIFAKEALLFRNQISEVGLNKGLRYKFDQPEFKILQHYTRNLIVLNFFKRYGQNLSIQVPAGQKFYTITSVDKTINPNNKVINKAGRKIVLDNTIDIATFKHLMDTYIIPRLIQDDRFENEAFIRALAKDDDTRDSFTGQAITGYKLNIPLIHLESAREINDYSRVLYSFNKLLYTPIPSDYNLGEAGHSQWTIGNLFFLYNLLAYKDRIGGNSMTRLLEDAVTSNNRGTLTDLYYRYISGLDKGTEKIYDENGNLDPTKFAYDIKDLLRWLATSDSAEYKFGVTSERDGRYYTRISVGDEWKDVERDQDILSDLVFNMPYLTESEDGIIFKPATPIGNINRKNTYKYNDKDVFDAIVNAMYEKYTKDLPIAVLDRKEISEWFSDYSAEEIEALQNSPGFIINGEIYLNSDKFDLKAPLHEMMHFVAAGMKFSTNPMIRSFYYKLLDNVTERMLNPETEEDKELVKLFNSENSPYRNRVASDKAEEYLVTILARQFQKDFETNWGDSRQFSKSLIQANVRQVLAEIFKNSKIKYWEQEGIDLAKVPLEDVVYLFADQILIQDPKLHSGNMILSQELADLKNFLEKHGFIRLENCV